METGDIKMELNYERKYAYAEVDEILKWLGEEYITKVPKKILDKIKEEKKFGYRPEIDFSKPIEPQVRQETKNIIAYLNYQFWLKDEKERKRLEERIRKNHEKKEEQKRIARRAEIEERAKMQQQPGSGYWNS